MEATSSLKRPSSSGRPGLRSLARAWKSSIDRMTARGVERRVTTTARPFAACSSTAPGVFLSSSAGMLSSVTISPRALRYLSAWAMAEASLGRL